MLGAECQMAPCQSLIVGTWWKLSEQLLQEDGLKDYQGLGLWPKENSAVGGRDWAPGAGTRHYSTAPHAATEVAA